MRRYVEFWFRMFGCALRGGPGYSLWLAFLATVVLLGLWSYHHHLTEGLIVTNMTDHVSWGIGIANFVFFVGVGAAAAVLVVPAYAFGRKDVEEVVVVGELLAFCAVVMCMLFIATDLGRPERLWHLLPPLGLLNLPESLLAWDVLVFMGYLVLNLHIPGYLLYKHYLSEKPLGLFYLPFVYLSMGWAVSIHTVTAFLLSGLASRPFWNSAIMAPRFLISAFASGPALLIIILLVARRTTALRVRESVIRLLSGVLRVTMPINLFLLGCDLFIEFYPGTQHSVHAVYLYLGLGEHDGLTRIIWTAVGLNALATLILEVRPLRERRALLVAACVLTIVGIWTEKGMGLIFPGFTPSPLGEVVEYSPNLGEVLVNFAVLALGAMMFTVMAKVAIAIQTGVLRFEPSLAETMMRHARRDLGREIRPAPAPRRPGGPELPYALLSPAQKLRRALRRWLASL